MASFHHKQTILILDGNEQNVLSLRDILHEEDLTLFSLKSSEAANDLLLDSDVDLILVNSNKSGVNCFKTIESIKNRQENRHIPVIILLEKNHGEQELINCYNIGAMGHIDMPLNPQIVISKIRVFLEISAQRKELQAKNKALLITKKNADSIFSSLEEGICVINRDFSIQPHFSIALEAILNTPYLSHKNFLNVLKEHLSLEEYKNTAEFLDLLLDRNVDEAQIAELNPLQNVKYKMTIRSENDEEFRYLDFKFKRIVIAGNIEELVITVYDRTDQIILKKKLEEAELKSQQTYELINILKMEPILLREFLKQVDKEISSIRDSITGLKKTKKDMQKLELIYRLIHSIKGNAALLGLDFISKTAHEFEQLLIDCNQDLDTIIPLKNGFLSLTDQIAQTVIEIHELINTMKNFYEHFNSKRIDEGYLLITAVKKIINNSSATSERKIELDHKGFNPKDLPSSLFLSVKDVLVQLTRNSIAHSVEENDDNSSQKPLTIFLSSVLKGNRLELKFKDNGRGLRYDKIREKAIQQKKLTKTQAKTLTDEQVGNLIFESGLSTSTMTDLVAGRGVGMGIIKQKLLEIGGDISVESEQGKHCTFNLYLPIEMNSN